MLLSRRDPLMPRYPRRWRRNPPVAIDWNQVFSRAAHLQEISPAGVALIDQIGSAFRDLLAGFGIHTDDPREVWAVAVGIVLFDMGVGKSDLDETAKEELSLLAGACVQSLIPLIREKA